VFEGNKTKRSKQFNYMYLETIVYYFSVAWTVVELLCYHCLWYSLISWNWFWQLLLLHTVVVAQRGKHQM